MGPLLLRRKPVWLLIASVAVLILGLAVVGYRAVWNYGVAGGEAERAASAATGGVINGTVTGDCNAVGIDNTVTCTVPQVSLANIEVDEGTVDYLWFDGPPTSLPAAPGERPASGTCPDLAKWLRGESSMYFTGPRKTISLFSGEPDLVTLTNVEVTIVDRKAVDIGAGTWIVCTWGGGSTPYFVVDVNTMTRKSTLTEYDDAGAGWLAPRPMPPAAVALDESAAAKAEIVTTSVPGHAYAGYVTAQTSKNGKGATLTIGSADRPLRWYAATDHDDYQDGDDYFGWDPAQNLWIKNYRPF